MRSLWVGLVAIVTTACNQSDFGPPDFGSDPPPGPGSPTWDNTDLSCSTDHDCAPGEKCDGSRCRPKQCDDGPYQSLPPMGPHRLLFRDEEIAVIDGSSNQGSYWVDAYGASGSIDYHGPGGGSFSISNQSLVDVARVDTASGPGMVVATSGQKTVTISGTQVLQRTLDVGVVPVAVAAGDVDGDGVDDVVALASDGTVAVCSLAGACNHFKFDNVTGVDVAAADVDGDGLAEVVLLFQQNGKALAAVWSVDTNSTVAAGFDTTFMAVTAVDIDKDGYAEVALLEDGGYLGLASDRVNLYKVGSGWTGMGVASVNRSAVDLSSGNPDGQNGDTIVVLGSGGSLEVLRWNGSSLATSYSGSTSVTSSPKRVAMFDADGDSVAARLVSGPDLVAANLAPIMVVTFPPYDATIPNGGTSGVAVGNRTDQSMDLTTTVSMNAGVEVGVGADFLDIFSAKLSTRVSNEVSHSQTLTKRYGVGTRFSLKPQVDLYGDRYGAVVVGGECFHNYIYELVDPTNRMGGTGHQMMMVVPVGGTTTVLSTPRYNALAQLQTTLPIIQVPTQIGNPKSYPNSPMKLDGSAVQPDEQVFPQRPTLTVSDSASVAFSLSVGSAVTNIDTMTTSISISSSLGALGVTFGASLGASWGQSFALTIGNAAEFAGDVPPVYDDPHTPEDEYQTHGFSYTPYVYRETYGTGDQKSGYYVINYAVGTP
jgi:hypothetical protein